MSHLYLLLGRAALAFLFIFSGAGRLAHYAAAQQSFEQLGMPGALLPVVILLEVGGGVAVLAGVFTRVAAGVLGLFSLAVGVLAYGDLTDQNQFIQLSKHAVMAGGYLMLVATGAGAFSVDAGRRAPEAAPAEDCVVC